MNRNKLIPIALAAGLIVVIGLIVWQVKGGGGLLQSDWTGVEGTPVNVSLDFFEAWMDARAAGPDEPFNRGLLDYKQVSPALKEKLAAFQGKLAEASSTDPVMCQTTVPEGLRTLPVFEKDGAAQVLIMSTTKGQAGQAVVTLAGRNGLWQISDITCGNAEQAPKGEFSFDKSGFLLKQVPAPLDSKYWHLVFQEEGVLGHAVPLYISDTTECTNKEGVKAACDDNLLKETSPAHVQGELTETGVNVKKIQIVESVSIN